MRISNCVPCPKRGIVDSAIHCKSMLQASNGRWGLGIPLSRGPHGNPLVTKRRKNGNYSTQCTKTTVW